MKRRDMLKTTGVIVTGLSTFPFSWVAASGKKKQRVLYFTRSAGYEHGMVRRKGGELGFSEKLLTKLGKQHGIEFVCTKDGRVFDEDLSKFDTIAFYTTGDLTKPNKRKTPPMTPAGKKKLLSAIKNGIGFVGFHSSTDSFHSKGKRNEIQENPDPYIAMIGGEFISHGAQQNSTLINTSPKFPGAAKFGKRKTFKEEWYALKNFPKDLHVIFVQDTKGMKGGVYQRPPYPETWAHMYGKGRVFYTSFGHREDIWTNPLVQGLMMGGFAWTMGNVKTDVTPNIEKVAPKGNQLKN